MPGLIRNVIAKKSLQPSPACSSPLRQLMFGPPVRRSDVPWLYSWKIVSARKDASRITGRVLLMPTLPVAGSAALIAVPVSRAIATTGIVTGGTIEPLRIGGAAAVL